jgi:amino-acid N-acetyltransferase
MSAAVSIARAGSEEADRLLALLADNGLPTEGFAEHLHTAIVARHDRQIIGCAALELYADGALLRSVAVAKDWQRQQVGRTLTLTALQLAKDSGASAVYLLTTTAERYFPRFGFERIERGEVPSLVLASVEFTSACPSSAIVMRRRLA